MYKNGFLKVCAITPDLEVGNPNYNVKVMLEAIKDIKASIAVFPELSLTGYTAGDLFYESCLLDDVKEAVEYFLENNTYKGLVFLGAPVEHKGSLFNTCLVVQEHKLLGIVPKRSLPNSGEFYEKRWFKSSQYEHDTKIKYLSYEVPFGKMIFKEEEKNINIGVEICEDMWASITPGNILALGGANVIVNISASNEVLGKAQIRRNTVLENSRRNAGAYIYASAGVNESTSETVFSGHNIVAEEGKLLVETENFSSQTEVVYADIDISKINFKRRQNTNLHDDLGIDTTAQIVNFTLEESSSYEFERKLDITPFVPKDNVYESFMKIASLQEYALFKRLKHTHAKSLVIGVSGGLDSTLALLVAYQAFKKLNYDMKNIIAVTMPGLGTSKRTKSNAMGLMKKLDLTILVKPINKSVMDHFKLIEHDPEVKDVTYENVQARIRTLILMDLANEHNGLVLGTGDMSEIALGWCTYNGDQMSMYGINSGVPKTLVRFMIENYATYKFNDCKNILLDIVDTPISPELAGSDQKTEDAIGKYEVNDFILYRFLTCGDSEDRVKALVMNAFGLDEAEADKYVSNFFKRFFTQQFKRQASPDGPKILDVALSPRADWRMPSDIKRW